LFELAVAPWQLERSKPIDIIMTPEMEKLARLRYKEACERYNQRFFYDD